MERAFTKILQDEADADAQNDDSDFKRRTVERYFAVDEKGSVETRSETIAHRPSTEIRRRIQREYQEVGLTERVSDVHVENYGNTAIVRSQLVTSLILNGESVEKRYRLTHVFVREGDRWLLASRQETVIPLDPIPVQTDRKLYNDYVGRYQLTSSRTYTVTRDGDRLFWGNTVKRELVPESDTTFVIKGDQYRVTFVRDAQGAVTHLRLREFPGVEYSAIRVPPPVPANAAALPPLFFNHSAVIVSPATYNAIAAAPLLQTEFAHREDRNVVRDHGQTRYSGIYLFGQHTYFEIMQPDPTRELGDIHIALWADRQQDLKPYVARLAAIAGANPASHSTSVPIDGRETNWFEFVEPFGEKPAPPGVHASVWAMSVFPGYLKARYPDLTAAEDGTTREMQYARRFDKQLLFRDIDRITFRTQPREAEWLCDEFRAFGLAETRTPDGVLFSAGDTTFVVQRVAPVIRRTVTFHVVLNGPAAEQTLLLGDSRLSLHPDRTAEWVFEN